MITQSTRLITKDQYADHGIIGVWSTYGTGFWEMDSSAELDATNEMINPDKKPYSIQTGLFPAIFYREAADLELVIKQVGVGKMDIRISKTIIIFKTEVDKIFFEEYGCVVEAKEIK